MNVLLSSQESMNQESPSMLRSDWVDERQLFPNDDPEDALVKLLERARKQAIRQAEKQIRVLHLGQESEENQGENPEKPISQVDDWVENPIGQLQELCQKQQITLPRYGFSERPNGFSCNVQAMGLQENGEESSKQEAKTKAARELLSKINSRL